MSTQADIGLIGLAVMGQNLVLNMNDKGYTVAVYNRTTSKVEDFIKNEDAGREIIGAFSLEEFTASLKRPRKVMLMVKAGKPVDLTIESLLPYLEPGDIIIDGGNSHFPDSTRRQHTLAEKGILFVGAGGMCCMAVDGRHLPWRSAVGTRGHSREDRTGIGIHPQRRVQYGAADDTTGTGLALQW